MRSTFLPSISPFPSPVDSVFTRSQSAWVSKSLVKSSRRGSVVAGAPAGTGPMIRRDFKGLLRPFLRLLHAPNPRYGAPAPRCSVKPVSDSAKRAPQACSSGANRCPEGRRQHRALHQLAMFPFCSIIALPPTCVVISHAPEWKCATGSLHAQVGTDREDRRGEPAPVPAGR